MDKSVALNTIFLVLELGGCAANDASSSFGVGGTTGENMKSSENTVTTNTLPDELRFIKLREVLTICGKSRSSIYAAVKSGAFPAPVKLSERSSAWIKSEVLQWAQACIDSSRQDVNAKKG